MIITFLGYLLVFEEEKKNRIFKLGIVYILAVFLTYLTTGLLFYGVAYYLQRIWLAVIFKYIIGGGVMAVGLVHLKDVIWPDSPFHLQMSKAAAGRLGQWMKRVSLPMSALIGVAVTAFSTPCMLPLYVGTATVLARSGLPMLSVLVYFLYYNLVFILPLILILVVMARSEKVVVMKEMTHKYEKPLKLLMGTVLVIVGYLIISR